MTEKNSSDKDSTVFIGLLPPDYKEELEAHFKQFGPLCGRLSYFSNYALINFESMEVRDAAVAGSQRLKIQEYWCCSLGYYLAKEKFAKILSFFKVLYKPFFILLSENVCWVFFHAMNVLTSGVP